MDVRFETWKICILCSKSEIHSEQGMFLLVNTCDSQHQINIDAFKLVINSSCNWLIINWDWWFLGTMNIQLTLICLNLEYLKFERERSDRWKLDNCTKTLKLFSTNRSTYPAENKRFGTETESKQLMHHRYDAWKCVWNNQSFV